MKSILKVSAMGLIAMVLAGGGCPTLRSVDGDIDEFIDRIYQPQNLVALYDKADDYDCAGSPCVNAETPYYSALVARDSSAPTKLSKTLVNVWGDDGVEDRFLQLLPSNSAYICTLTTENSYCADSPAPIAVNLSSAYRGENLLPGNYADKVIVMNLLGEEYINSQGDRLIITSAKQTNDRISLRVGIDISDNTCVATDVNCVNVPLSNFADYADSDNKYLLPVALAGLRATQLFTLFPDAPNVVVRDMLRDNVTCIVSFVCLAITHNLAGRTPYSYDLTSYTSKALYENPSLYHCSASRPCVNAETPYYSALVAKDGSATSKMLTQTLVNVWGDDDVGDRFLQLLPSDSAYVCVVVSATENCSGSSAPIAVNFDIDNRADNLPGNYADKVIVMNLPGEYWLRSQGDRLIITPATTTNERIALRIGTGEGDKACGTESSVICIDIALSNFADYADSDNKYLLPVALAGLRATQLFTLFPGAPNVVVRNTLKNENCLLYLRCLAIGNSVNDRTPPWSFELTFHTLKDLYENPSLYHCSASDACVNAETPYYSYLVARDSSAPTKLSKTLLNVWGDDGVGDRSLQLLPSNSAYICVVGAEVDADENCSNNAPIAVNFDIDNRNSDLPEAYADKVTVTSLASRIATEGDRLIITPATMTNERIALRIGTGNGDKACGTASNITCIDVALSNFSDYADGDNKYLLPVLLAGLRATQLFTLFPGAPNVVVREMLKITNCLLLLECSAIENSVNNRTPWSFVLTSYEPKVLYENPSLYHCSASGSCINAETPYYSSLVAQHYSAKIAGDDSGLSQILINVWKDEGVEDRFLQLLPSDSAYVCVVVSATENCSGSSAPIAVNFDIDNRADNLPGNYADKVIVMNLLDEGSINSQGDRLIITPATDVGGSLNVAEAAFSKISLRVGTEDSNTCSVVNCVNVPLSNFADYADSDNKYLLPVALAGLRAAQLFTLFPNALNVVVRDVLKNMNCILYLRCLAITNKFAGKDPFSFELASYDLKTIYENPSRYHCSASGPCVNAETPYYSALIARDSSALSKILINVFAEGTLSQRFLQLLPSDSYYCQLTTEGVCSTPTVPIAVNFYTVNRANNLPEAYADKVTVTSLDSRIATEGDRLLITPATMTDERISLRVGTGDGDKACGTASSVTCIDIALDKFADYTNGGAEFLSDLTSENEYFLPVALAGLRATQLFTLFPGASNFSIVSFLKNEDCVLYLRCFAITNKLAEKTPFFYDLASYNLKTLYENPSRYPCSVDGQDCVNAATPYYSALVARDSSALTKILINVWAGGGDTALPFSQLLPNNSEYICTLALNNSYCADSSAPIAVNYSSAYRGENLLPVAYADKVIVMNLLSEGFINSQGDRLIITPATDVSKKLMNVATSAVALSKISLRVGTEGDNTCSVVNCVNVPLSNFVTYKDVTKNYLLPVALAGLRAAQLFTLFPDAPNVVVRDVLKDNVTCIVSFVCFAITNKLAGSTPYSYDLTSYTLKDLYDNPSLYHCSASGPCVNAETPYYSALIAKDSSAPTKLSKTLINVWANDGSLYWGVFSQLLPGGSGYICVVVSATENCSASSAPIAVNLSSANRGGNVLPPAYADKVIVMNLLDEGFINGQGDRLIITPATDVSDKLENVAEAAFSKISLRVGTSGTNTCSVVNCVNVPLSNFSDYADSDNKYLLPVALAGLRATQLFTMFPDAPNVVVRDMLKTTNCLLLLKCSAIGNSVNGRTPPWSFSLASYDLKVLYDNPSLYHCSASGPCVNAETPYYSALIARDSSATKMLTKILIHVFTRDDTSLGQRFFALLPGDSEYICTLTQDNACGDSTAPIAVNTLKTYRVDSLPSDYEDKVTVMNLLTDYWIDAQGDRFIITPATESTLIGITLRVGIGITDNTCVATDVNCVNIPLSKFTDYTDVTKDYWLPVVLAGLRATQLFTLFPDAPNFAIVGLLKEQRCVLDLRCLAITNKLAGDDPFSYDLKTFYENPEDFGCSDTGRACVNAETPYYSARIVEGGLTSISLYAGLDENSDTSSLMPIIRQLAPNYSCNNPCSDAPIELGQDDAPKIYASVNDTFFGSEAVFNIGPSASRAGGQSTLYVGTGEGDKACGTASSVTCIDVTLSNFDDYTGVTKDYKLPIALVALRAAQLFSMFPTTSDAYMVTMLKNTDCVLLLQCLAITDSFTEDTGTSGTAGEASSPSSGASASLAGSVGSGSASSAGSSNSFIADIGSMTTYGKRQVFWSDGGLSVETRSHKIYRGGAHAMALTYRSMMGTLDITTGWTSQSSALGMEQMFLRGSSLGVFGALRYDVGSYLEMRPYVGLVASWHSMLETPKSITIMTANEVHVRAGVDVDVKGMRFALEGRCGQHQHLIGYGALFATLAETSCSTHLKASVSF